MLPKRREASLVATRLQATARSLRVQSALSARANSIAGTPKEVILDASFSSSRRCSASRIHISLLHRPLPGWAGSSNQLMSELNPRFRSRRRSSNRTRDTKVAPKCRRLCSSRRKDAYVVRGCQPTRQGCAAVPVPARGSERPDVGTPSVIIGRCRVPELGRGVCTSTRAAWTGSCPARNEGNDVGRT